jgi:hypothetical protein
MFLRLPFEASEESSYYLPVFFTRFSAVRDALRCRRILLQFCQPFAE